MTLAVPEPLRAPFPRFGGKRAVAADVWAAFGRVDNYVEPFFGTGAVLLGRPDFDGSQTETVNDADCYLANFWRALAADAEAVATVADWPVNECVPAGTMIATPGGPVPVERVRTGMAVLGYDGANVVETVVSATRASLSEGPLVRVGPLRLTGNHPLWTPREYVDARALRDGSIVGVLVESERGSSLGGHGAATLGGVEVQAVDRARREDARPGAPSSPLRGARGQGADAGAPAEDRRRDDVAQGGALGDGSAVRFDLRCRALARGNGGFDLTGDPQGHALQGKPAPAGVGERVYNFQTGTCNYFAAGILVHNCDLHARHRWLVGRAEFRERMKSDPDYYDAKIAGWWVWGACAWIGSGWCHTRWFSGGVGDSDRPSHPSRQLPHLGDAGMGIHRKPTHRRDVGREYVYDLCQAVSKRLRRVRVVCGDWTRVTGDSVTVRHGRTGVFLDPPYAEGADDLYSDHSKGLSAAVRAWAVEAGEHPEMRIAFCGYDGEHVMPVTWREHVWKARGGYGSQREDGANENAKRERIWFSPHCLRPEPPKQGTLW